MNAFITAVLNSHGELTLTYFPLLFEKTQIKCGTVRSLKSRGLEKLTYFRFTEFLKTI